VGGERRGGVKVKTEYEGGNGRGGSNTEKLEKTGKARYSVEQGWENRERNGLGGERSSERKRRVGDD